MAQLKIYKFPEPILKQAAKEVSEWTPQLYQLSRDMLETMYAAPGIGLAAPQVGQSLRMIVIDCRPRLEDGTIDLASMTALEKKIPMPLVLVNPKILEKKGKTIFEEGCLSVPGFYEDVQRFEWIKFQGQDVKGNLFEHEVDGVLSVCIQHEIDHLDGKLFIDRLSMVKRSLIKTKIQKHGYPSQNNESKDHVL